METDKTAIERYRAVKAQILEAEQQAGREKGSVRLVGVTKTIDPQIINAVLDDGLTVIGENRVQEMMETLLSSLC